MKKSSLKSLTSSENTHDRVWYKTHVHVHIHMTERYDVHFTLPFIKTTLSLEAVAHLIQGS